jgi:curved DNA-binding protein CbpA
MARTFYDVLDVDEDAEKAEIRRTYRAKAKEHHPDVSDDPGAAERFKRINRAAEVLGDPAERARYDRLGHEAYVASEGEPGEGETTANAATADGDRTPGGGSGSGHGQPGATNAGATVGAAGSGTTTEPGSGTAGPWGPDSEATDRDADGVAGSERHGRGAREKEGPWTGFHDTDGPGRATAGGSIGASVGADRERTARWGRPHQSQSTGPERAPAWDRTPQPSRPNAWLVALSTIGSGRIVDQWGAFRRGLLLVYLYPVVLTVLLAEVSPPITIAAAAVAVLVAIYGSGIPNVGTLVFGLLGGLITVFLVQSPYALSSPTAVVLLAACWVPLAHSVLVAWLLHRSRE